MSAKIKIGYAADERLAENYPADVDWINERRLELYEQYGSCVILVYHEEVVGHGADLEEAVLEAEKRFANEDGLVTPVIKMLSNPYRIGMFRPRKQSD